MPQITILRSSDGRPQCKKFELDGDQLKSIEQAWAFLFDVEQCEIGDLHQLSALLKDLEKQPNAFIVRGKLNEGQSSLSVRRRFAGVGASFRAHKCQWLCVDIDHLAPPNELPHFNEQPNLVAEYAASHLSQEFHGVDFYWQYSGSMGIKPGIRIHLWFWLSRPITDQEARAWLLDAQTKIDFSLYTPIQPHFTAAPIFKAPAEDPVDYRSDLFEWTELLRTPIPCFWMPLLTTRS